MTQSAGFAGAPRLAAFLRFIVGAALSGRSDSIKAYTVAVGALGRPADFDPVTDAAVRVEAGRLRLALTRYYESADDPILIAVPRGGYVPEFRRRPAAALSSDAAMLQLVEAIPGLAEARRWHTELHSRHRRERELLIRNINTMIDTLESLRAAVNQTRQAVRRPKKRNSRPSRPAAYRPS